LIVQSVKCKISVNIEIILVRFLPGLMRGGGGLAADAGSSALGRGAPVSGARMRRVVAVAALPSFSPLGGALAQFHARLFVVRARYRHRYAGRALAARAGRARLPLM